MKNIISFFIAIFLFNAAFSQATNNELKGKKLTIVRSVTEISNDTTLCDAEDTLKLPTMYATKTYTDLSSRGFNLKQFGAKGLGIASYKEDSAALVDAIEYIRQLGRGSLFIPATTQFYAYKGEGIVLPDNIEIIGEGNASHIRNVDPSASTYYRGALFFTSTYGPSDSISLFSAPKYVIQSVPVGDSQIVLDNSADISHFYVDKLIGIGSGVFLKNGDSNQRRWLNFELNKILRIDGDTLFLKYPVSSAYPDTAYIVDVNDNGITHPKLDVPMHIASNVQIHNLYLSQAETNEVDTSTLTKFPTGILGTGGMFESSIHDLTINGFIGFGGNMLCRSDIYNLKIYANQKIMDWGYNSHNSKFHDISMEYLPSKFFDRSISAIYLNEGSHDLEMYNIKASGSWKGNSIFQIAGGAKRITVNNVDVDFPFTGDSEKDVLFISDDEDSVYVKDIKLSNIRIKVDSCQQFIRINGRVAAPVKRNLVLNNITFSGKASNTDYAVYVNRAGNIYMKNIFIPEGDTVYLANLDTAIIEDLQAPKSYLETSGTTTGQMEIRSPKVEASNVTSYRNEGIKNNVYGSNASTIIGIDAGSNSTGSRITALGRSALRYNVTGDDNTAVGQRAAEGDNGISDFNAVTSIGANSAVRLRTGADSSTFIGFEAGSGVIYGKKNTLIDAVGHAHDSNTINIRNALFVANVKSRLDSNYFTPDARFSIKDFNPQSYFDFKASDANYSSLIIPTGITPTTPLNNSVWSAGGHLYIKLSDIVYQLDGNIDSSNAPINMLWQSPDKAFHKASLPPTYNMPSYTMLANNTASTANATTTVFKEINWTDYSGTVTWDGTAPSGTTTIKYMYVQHGRQVTFTIQGGYVTPGVTNTVVKLNLPGDLPVPSESGIFTTANTQIFSGSGGFGAGNTTVSNNNKVGFVNNSTDTGYQLAISGASTSAQYFWATITYFVTPPL